MNAAQAKAIAPKLEAIAGGQERAEGGTPLQQLESLLALPTIGRRLVRVRMYGRGSEGSADLILDDGSTLTFPALALFASPAKLNLHLALSIGVAAKLKGPEAQQAAVLLYQAAEREEGFSEDDLARGWGIEYLQAADVLDVDLADQEQRWAAFSRLATLEPWSKARENGGSVAAASIVLRHQDGSRLVRCGWYYGFVRTQDVGLSASKVAARMERVGWRRNGSRGAIKATAPGGLSAPLIWTFYHVPSDWQEAS